MKISEIIKILERAEKEQGDLEVTYKNIYGGVAPVLDLEIDVDDGEVFLHFLGPV